jgi:DNA-binding NarL/FixJ family response regulator
MDTPADRRARVLIVDDHPMVREGLRSMLGGNGVEVVGEAGSGAQALETAAALAPDVILLDMELPDLNGLADVLDELVPER